MISCLTCQLLLISLVVTLLGFTAPANASISDSTIIINDSDSKIRLSPYVSYYIDESAKLAVEEVQQQNFEIKDKPGSTRLFGFTDAAIWIKFQITTSVKNGTIVYIQSENRMLEAFDLYQTWNGKSLRQRAGALVPLGLRDYHHNLPTFKVQLEENRQYDIYIRTTTSQPLKAPLLLYSGNQFYTSEYYGKIVEGVVYGLTLGLLIYNLALWRFSTNINYLYLAIYIVTAFGVAIALQGHSIFLWPNWVKWDFSLSNASGALLISAVSLQLAGFVRAEEVAPKWNQAYRWFAIFGIIGFPLAFVLSHFWYLFYIGPLGIALCSSIIFFLSQRMMLGDRSAKIYLISISLPIISGLIYIFHGAGLIPSPPYLGVYQTLATSLQVLILSIGLSDLINLTRRRTAESEQSALVLQANAEGKSLFPRSDVP